MERRRIVEDASNASTTTAPGRRRIATSSGGDEIERHRISEDAPTLARKQVRKKPPATFISTGCAVLDCVLGSGYPMRRITNIVGDKSVGKTLLAIEAAANFAKVFPRGKIRYNEVEAAFDPDYAGDLGLPLSHVSFPSNKERCETVEDLYEDLLDWSGKLDGQPALYVLDSLDALSDRAEMKRGIDEASYGASKARQMSQLFRRINQRLVQANVMLIIISQVRDNIGVTFGRKYSRSGGRALDFYASIVLYLAHLKTRTKTINKVTRPVAVDIRAKCEKNKVAAPFRTCDITLRFGFGIDDVLSNLDWLDSVGALDEVGIKGKGETADKEAKKYIERVRQMNNTDYAEERMRLASITQSVWAEVEKDFAPTRKKYA